MILPLKVSFIILHEDAQYIYQIYKMKLFKWFSSMNKLFTV